MAAIQSRGEKGQELTGGAKAGTVNGDRQDRAQNGQGRGWAGSEVGCAADILHLDVNKQF